MENKHLKEALREAGRLIKGKLKAEASNDGFRASGKLDKSFRYRVIKNELHLFGEEYANALSKGITDKGKYNYDMAEKLEKWARSKGMRPLFRNKKGRFRNVTTSSWKSLGYVLARSIAGKSPSENRKNKNGGISKRFGYKGSGFIQTVKNQMKKEVASIISAGYKKDILAELDKIKRI
jgi:hypothetical protein